MNRPKIMSAASRPNTATSATSTEMTTRTIDRSSDVSRRDKGTEYSFTPVTIPWSTYSPHCTDRRLL